jgi:PAS domain S-box-containing protein
MARTSKETKTKSRSPARKSRAALEQEIVALRNRVTQLEGIEIERQQTEAALRESEARQRVSFDYAFSFHVDDQGNLILDWLTESFTRITGYATETLIGKPNPLQQYIHPDDLAQVTQTLQSLPPEQPTEYEFRIVAQDGSIRWLRSRTCAHAGQDGQPRRIDGATLDITERKHMEEALQQTEERLSLFLHHLPGVAFIKDLEGHYLYANETLVNLWKTVSPDKALGWLGRTDLDLFPTDVAEQVRANDQRILSSGQSEQLTETIPYPDGPQEWLVSKFPIVDPWGIPVMLGGIGIDMTKRR